MPGWSRTWQCQNCHLKMSMPIFTTRPPDIGDDSCFGPPLVDAHDWQLLTRDNAKTRLDRWGQTTVGEFCSMLHPRTVARVLWERRPRPLERRRETRESRAAAADLLEMVTELREDR